MPRPRSEDEYEVRHADFLAIAPNHLVSDYFKKH